MRPIEFDLGKIPDQDLAGIGSWIVNQGHSMWPTFSLWLGQTLSQEAIRRQEAAEHSPPYVQLPQMADEQLKEFAQGAVAFQNLEPIDHATGRFADLTLVVVLGEMSNRLIHYGRHIRRQQLESN